MKKYIFLLLSFWMIGLVQAQKNFPVNGVADERPGTVAIINATLYQDYQTKIDNATLLIRDGRIVAAGSGVTIPKGAKVVDVKGKFVYPAFVDPYTSYGLPEIKRQPGGFGGVPQYDSKTKGAFGWNEAVKSEYDAIKEFSVDTKSADDWRKNGFGAVNTFRADGIVRGSAAMVSTVHAPDQEAIIRQKSAAHYSFDKGTSRQQYPSSIMGMVALLRQTYYDAKWYASGGNKEQTNLSLEAFNQLQNLPQVFEANSDKLRVLLADKMGDEFGIQYIIKGNGDEYQRLNEIKATKASLIIPVNYPDAYDVEDPLAALDVAYDDLKHWELAAFNAVFLQQQGIPFGFTTNGLKKKEEYLANIRKTVKNGLPETQALQAMTATPARLLRVENEVGALRPGLRASFVVSSGNIFDDKSFILQTWVDGKPYEFKPLEMTDFSGQYALAVDGKNYKLSITGDAASHKAQITVNDSVKIDTKLKIDGESISLTFKQPDQKMDTRLTGWKSGNDLKGTGLDAAEKWLSWQAIYQNKPEDDAKKENKKDEAKAAPAPGAIVYPFVAYGWSERPKAEAVLFKNATVWTMEANGSPEEMDVLVQNGKIIQVGKNLNAPAARQIDAKGKHLTPGIIDEHSHVALSGVNEGSHSVTSEVRMYDAVNSEDINIYRQLAGGVTAAQLLHGSANAVGGQSALIKFRWGLSPDELRIQGADGYIKFALGENVKQSNWGDGNTIRFPQTRMGVEQVYIDAFTRARAYDAEWKAYNNLPPKTKAGVSIPRRDLQMEALAEILNKKRFISCHSYVQSEINMLIKVADQFGFTVNTFTHILEGYKVADKMATHGSGGSTFSDWWIYKYEVKDAIPYNAALMKQAGVTVAINSDDAEMARRLNHEAAKSIKFGNMDEWEAMKMVTINPAKLLHLDKQTGSIKQGKDADLVLWTGHPLSVYSKPEITMVDGVIYYDLKKDAEAREAIQAERARIIAAMRDVKKSGGRTAPYMPKEQHIWDCEDIFGLEMEGHGHE